MGKILKGLMLAAVGLAFTATGSWAAPVSIGFGGIYTLSDSTGSGFSDQLTHSGAQIAATGPSLDPIFGANLLITSMNIDENDPYKLLSSFYGGGFIVENFFQADLSVFELEKWSDHVGAINSEMTINLSNIVPHGSYTLGSSAIADAFVTTGAGSTVMAYTMHQLFPGIDNGKTLIGVFSGSATPIPEPATMLLFATGLAGLAGLRRSRGRSPGTAS